MFEVTICVHNVPSTLSADCSQWYHAECSERVRAGVVAAEAQRAAKVPSKRPAKAKQPQAKVQRTIGKRAPSARTRAAESEPEGSAPDSESSVSEGSDDDGSGAEHVDAHDDTQAGALLQPHAQGNGNVNVAADASESADEVFVSLVRFQPPAELLQQCDAICHGLSLYMRQLNGTACYSHSLAASQCRKQHLQQRLMRGHSARQQRCALEIQQLQHACAAVKCHLR